MSLKNHDSHEVPKYSLENYDIWKFRMEAHLSSIYDMMWDVFTNGPIQIMKVKNFANGEDGVETGGLIPKPKPRSEMTTDKIKQINLDKLDKFILLRTVEDANIGRLMKCKTTKEMWDELVNMGEGSEKIKENKLLLAVQKYETFEMLDGESIDNMENRFTNILNEINALGKEFPTKDISLKIIRSLPKK